MRQIEKVRAELGVPMYVPVELITRPQWIQRRADFRRKLARLARLEDRIRCDFVDGLAQFEKERSCR